MRAVKNKGSHIENLLAKELWARGYRYRRNSKYIYGKPDISIKKFKIAVFCDSEFWHGYNWETKKHEIKSNVAFWHKKIEGNLARDLKVNEILEREGWRVLRFWGNEIKKNVMNCVDKIEQQINESK